jgi:hypothetical protein
VPSSSHVWTTALWNMKRVFSYSDVEILKMTPILWFLNCEILGCRTMLSSRRILIWGRIYCLLRQDSTVKSEESDWLHTQAVRRAITDTRRMWDGLRSSPNGNGFHFNPETLNSMFLHNFRFRLQHDAVSQLRRPSTSGICGGKSGAGAGFLRVLRFPLPIFIPPNSLSSESPGAKVVDVPNGPSMDSTPTPWLFSPPANYTDRAIAAGQRS